MEKMTEAELGVLFEAMPRKVKKTVKAAVAKLDPAEEAVVKDWLAAQAEYEDLIEKYKIEEIGDKVRDLQDQVSEILMKTDEQAARVSDLIIKYSGYERKSVSWKEMFIQAFEMVNEAGQQTLKTLQAQLTKVTQVHKLKLLDVESIRPAVEGKLKEMAAKGMKFLKKLFNSLISKLRKSDQRIRDLAKIVNTPPASLESFESKIMAGEDVRDTLLGITVPDVNPHF